MIRWTGKDHRTPLEERERLILHLRGRLPARSVSLQTCNRVDLYAGDGPAPRAVARHLFRVTAGLESVLLGETPIQHQVKKAYADAAADGRCSPGLHKLFQAALRAGKRVRAETRLSTGPTSHAQIAVRCILERRPRIHTARILVLGATRLARGILKGLLQSGAAPPAVAAPDHAHAHRAATESGAHPIPMADAFGSVPELDILICAVSAPEPILRFDAFPKEATLLVVDLGVPRNADEAIGTLPGVTLLNIEDVERHVHRSIDRRRGDIVRAEAIIAEELDDYLRACASLPPRGLRREDPNVNDDILHHDCSVLWTSP